MGLRGKRTGEWRKIHNEEIYDLYSSSSIIRVINSRRMKKARQVAHTEDGRSAYNVLVGKPEGTSPLGRPRHRWEDNIKMELQEVGWGAWNGLIWLMIGRGGGYFGFHKTWGIF